MTAKIKAGRKIQTARGKSEQQTEASPQAKHKAKRRKSLIGARRTKDRTPKAAAKFITELASNGGIVTYAAQKSGIPRQRLYEMREQDPDFKAAWDKAVDIGMDLLEDEAKRRAFLGVEEPVFYQGEICGHVQKYSDALMIRMLQAHRPKYRDKQEVTGADGAPLVPGTVNFYLPKEDPLPDGGTGE